MHGRIILARLAPVVLAFALAVAGLPANAQAPATAVAGEAQGEAAAAAAPPEAATGIATIAGRLQLPLPVIERDRLLAREINRGFTASEVLRLDVRDGPELVLAVELITPDGLDASAVSEILASIAANLAVDGTVDEVRPVPIGGFRFHVVRRTVMAPPPGDVGAMPDPDALVATRQVQLFGAVQQVLLRFTLDVPEALEAREDALAGALAGLELDFASLLQQRAAFDEEAALVVSDERIATLFGDIPRPPGMLVALTGTRVLEARDGLRNGNGQVLVFAREGFWNLQFATLSLSCELQPEGVIDEEVQAFVGSLREDPRQRGALAGAASRLGPLPATRWAGRHLEERGHTNALRAADADGVRYLARVDQTAARRFADTLEAWLDEGARPQCAPRLPVRIGG